MKNVKDVTYPHMGGIHDEEKGRNVLKTQEEIYEECEERDVSPDGRNP